ncbi:MAG: GntR family transcriptional regulator [Gemmobacter sp.]
MPSDAPTLGWQDVQAEALRRIRSRDWPPGALIPNEADLARELGCARATVNRALRDLAEAGWLERRRKAGTRVAVAPVRKATFAIPIIRRDVEERGQRHGYRLLSQAVAPAPAGIATLLRLPGAAPMIHLRALHLADDRPWCLEDRWLNPAIPGVTGADFAALSANEWLVGNVPFSGGDIAFHALAADPATAALMDCAPGAALLAADRTTWAEAVPITAVRLTYAPGQRFVTTI